MVPPQPVNVPTFDELRAENQEASMEESSSSEEDSSDYSEANNEAQNEATTDGTNPKVAATGQVEETEI